MKLPIYIQTGQQNGEVTLNSKIFNIEVNQGLIHEALRLQTNNGRINYAHTKNKANIRGGGAKPFRQKGTGHARQGSIRNPHYKGGGVVFGPTNERNYTLRMPVKQRRKALFSCLSAKLKDKEILILEDYTISDNNKIIKTKNIKELIDNLKVERKGLFVLPERNELFKKSCNNLPNVKSILVNYLNVRDLLTYNKIIFFKNSLSKLEEIFLKKD
ncbi:MAG: 50S ribosomal protein L4 [Candidatus Peregrinibacteria bacterium GW2011_GWA2_33_10]|nr:MAG: 50S ribosomal protein L4 [Candidatus Peregrinibacteria bacterium GW2011_GWA2_33_10]KKP40754.1 MAG: 50S ribosomal protein L4, large subunit ribosomal protein L4 [Candidatus Peregrinibacteria bacterium GW2011_GWC2_33_13]